MMGVIEPIRIQAQESHHKHNLLYIYIILYIVTVGHVIHEIQSGSYRVRTFGVYNVLFLSLSCELLEMDPREHENSITGRIKESKVFGLVFHNIISNI